MPTLPVVLDTNVLLSGIAYPASVPGKIVGAWKHGARCPCSFCRNCAGCYPASRNGTD